MKSFFILTVFSFLFFSCSGYWGNDREMDGGAALAPLAIQGGGYLSSDTANDITPFLYRYPVDGKTYLFFSSDRDGDYNIYYAEMNSDGTFKASVKLGTNINTTNTEYSPVLYKSHLSYATNIYISLVRVESGGSITNIYTYIVSNVFNTYQLPPGITSSSANAKSISLLTKSDFMPVLMIAIGSTNLLQSTWNTFVTGGPCWNPPNSFLVGSTNLISGIDGYHIGTTSWTNIFIFDVTSEGKRALFKGFVSSLPATNFQKIAVYESVYNDTQPCLDLATMKVYFASDRYGKGNYDLYRYNHVTFDKIFP